MRLGIDRYSPVYRLVHGIWSQGPSRAGALLFLALLAFSIVGYFWQPYNPDYGGFPKAAPPSWAHPLGTTMFGQDVLSQLMAGGLPVIGLGVGVGIIGTLLAVLVGVVAGLYEGTAIDAVLTGIDQILLVIPGILILMVLAAYLRMMSLRLGYLELMIGLGVTAWPYGARTIRAQTIAIRRREFILSSQLIGESTASIVFNQVIPNNLPYIASSFFSASIYGVFGATLIYYLGLGSLAEVNWGTMLYWSLGEMAYINGWWWWYVPPGLMIGLLALSFALMNVGLDVVANPRLRVWKIPKGMKVAYPRAR